MYKIYIANVEIHQDDLNRVTKKHIAWAKKEELIEAELIKEDRQGLETLEIFKSESLKEASKFYENKTKYKDFSPEYMPVSKFWLFTVIALIEDDNKREWNEIQRTYL